MSELFKAPIARLAHALTDLQQLHPSNPDINKCFERARDATNDLAAELTQAKARIAELEKLVEELQDSADMACITPADDCDCSGCLYAAERSGDA